MLESNTVHMITARFSPNNADMCVCVCVYHRQLSVSHTYVCHIVYMMRSHYVKYSTDDNVQHRMFNV